MRVTNWFRSILASKVAILRGRRDNVRDDGVGAHSDEMSCDHVVWAYRLLLDREPESEKAVQDKLGVWRNTRELRYDLLNSTEYQSQNPAAIHTTRMTDRVVITESLEGLRFFVNLADVMIGLKIIEDCYEPEELEFIRRIVRPGMTALDIGANIGFFTVHLAAIVGDEGMVHAFEPIFQNFDLLRRSVAENNFEAQVEATRCGVGERTETGDFVFMNITQSVNSGGSYLQRRNAALPQGHTLEEAPIFALDDLNLRRPIDFIKIDIEGAERLAFRGAREILRADQPVILAELNPRQLAAVSECDPTKLISEMRELNYDCRLIEAGAPGASLSTFDDSNLVSVVFLPRRS